MDDAVVEDDIENMEHMEEIRNTDPQFLTTTLSSIGLFLQVYGWFILLAGGITYYLYSVYKKKQSVTTRRHSDVNLHRYDNEEVQKKHEGLEAARQRLQERYSMDALRHKEDEAVKEEEKRKERIADWERHQEGKGYKSKTRFKEEPSSDLPSGSSSSGQTKKRVYKADDYNPLTGSYGGSSYRPPARCGGGGGGGG